MRQNGGEWRLVVQKGVAFKPKLRVKRSDEAVTTKNRQANAKVHKNPIFRSE
jgi:hypothetical protein